MSDDEKNKAILRALKQADRDLVTARELIRGAIATKGETVLTAIIVQRVESALAGLKTIGGV